MKTGKITAITPKGSWAKDGQSYNRFNVTMADGNVYQFNAIGDFKHKVSEECSFTSEEKEYQGNTWNAAKLVRANPMQVFTKPAGDVQKLIVRQSSVASAVNFYKDQNKTPEDVIAFAEKIVNYIYS